MVPEGYKLITSEFDAVQPGDLYRVREDSHSEYCEWRSADHYAGTFAGFFAAWHSRDIQFCRPVRPAEEQPEQPPAPTIDRGSKYHRTIRQTLPEGYQLITDETERIQRGDMMRARDDDRSEYREWVTTEHIMETEVGYFHDWHTQRIQFCRPVQAAPKQPSAPTTDRGERYRRTITQSLPGDTIGLSITVDLADVLDAFGVPYMLAQAVKKAVLPGERGSKDRLKDLREAAWHIQRQIQIEEARQQEQADL